MRIHADLTRRAVIDTAALPWVPSPMAGVERKMLERDGGEVARATSIVRYAPGSRFSTHVHGGGEEFLVLDGTFSDEHGDYPAGTYVRNPPGSQHAPFSGTGCTLFVKLRQFAPDDLARIVIDTRTAAFAPGKTDAYDELLLHRHGAERVYLLRWRSGRGFPLHYHAAGEELFILEGRYADEHGSYGPGTWVRAPAGSSHAPIPTEGAFFYAKLGHLPAAAAAA